MPGGAGDLMMTLEQRITAFKGYPRIIPLLGFQGFLFFIRGCGLVGMGSVRSAGVRSAKCRIQKEYACGRGISRGGGDFFIFPDLKTLRATMERLRGPEEDK